ncbi:reverse transcriptase [Gossypium australe]|uniref:Reverse transcriptase n=1 Tax=Gossypium australe TaxID=47621 RepID=A0A5B6WRC4_9ROSI|nr:reverse transcriptase [Gossypium australe]
MSTVPSNDELNLDFIDNCITEDMNSRLTREFTDKEILEAFNQMDPRKAPGIDGLSSVDVIKFYYDVLNGNKDVASLNGTMIILIPKTKDPKDMFNFRPISLCRVLYKIISKVLANRLKTTLLICIS